MPHPEVIDMPFDKAAAVRVFAGAMILAGEAAQQYAGHYSAEFGSHNGNPALWTSHVRVGVPDEQGEAGYFMLAGMGYNTHNRLTASCADLPGADMASGAYLVTREALPAVARMGERLQGDPPPWSVRGVGDQATEGLEIHTAGLMPLTARLW